MTRAAGWLVFGGILMASAGCGGPIYRNGELRTGEAPAPAYRFTDLKPGPNNTDELFVCLTFSGGGTRAAALAYGLLEAMRETELPPLEPGGPPRTLLDEVDAISSVSGGSFTAAAYGLWREGLFDGRFEHRFLRHNVQHDLLMRVLSPVNLLLLPLVVLDRIDIAADYFHQYIFEERTYADLIAHGRRPFIVINATSAATGMRFEFTQDDFDILGSDLSTLPIGYAVAASSAVPVLLSPVRLKYYANAASEAAIRRSFQHGEIEGDYRRRRKWASTLVDPDRVARDDYGINTVAHQYLYLLDGALLDNLGVSWLLDNYRDGLVRQRIPNAEDFTTIMSAPQPDPVVEQASPDSSVGSTARIDASNPGTVNPPPPHPTVPAPCGSPDRPCIRRLLVIIVNAGNKPPQDMEARESAPGVFMMGYTAASIGVENASENLANAARALLVEEPAARDREYEKFARILREQCPGVTLPERRTPELDAYVVELKLSSVPNEEERLRLLALPTNYNLTPQDVDALVRVARQLLAEQPGFKGFLEACRK